MHSQRELKETLIYHQQFYNYKVARHAVTRSKTRTSLIGRNSTKQMLLKLYGNLTTHPQLIILIKSPVAALFTITTHNERIRWEIVRSDS
jgi:hypothetical protein